MTIFDAISYIEDRSFTWWYFSLEIIWSTNFEVPEFAAEIL